VVGAKIGGTIARAFVATRSTASAHTVIGNECASAVRAFILKHLVRIRHEKQTYASQGAACLLTVVTGYPNGIGLALCIHYRPEKDFTWPANER
jgi:hypothetical protein